jgi:REP element-mobilizing transposase RayT
MPYVPEWVERPLAYFLTFGTYGSRLHGDARGSIDRHHIPLDRDDFRRNFERRLMASGESFEIQPKHREVLERAFAETAAARALTIRALNVRLAHIHIVLSGELRPEAMLQALKANGTRWLRAHAEVPAGQRVWARHGSTRYLWTVDDLEAAVDYTMNQQGAGLPGSNSNVWRKIEE